MTACCQITCAIPWLPCEQLPYPPEHPRISRMQQRDKSDFPLPVLSYKYFLLWYSFSILSFYSPKSTFLAAALPENSKNFSKSLHHQSSKSSIFLLARKWPSTSSFPRSVSHPFSFRTFVVLLFIRDSFYWIPFFSFCSFILKTFRIWPIRL